MVLSGHWRTANLQPVKDSLEKYVWSLDPDIYVSTWDKRGVSKYANHVGINPNDEINTDIIKETYGNRLQSHKIDSYDKFLEIYGPNPYMVSNIHNAYPQFYLMKVAGQLLKESRVAYDFVIWSRPDVYYWDAISQNVFCEDDRILFHQNTPPAYHPNRVYALWMTSAQSVFEYYSQIFDHMSEICSDCGTGLDPSDPCRLLYCYLKDKYNIQSTDKYFCDVYR